MAKQRQFHYVRQANGKEWFEEKCFISRKPAETRWSIQELDEIKQKYKDKYEELLNEHR